LKIKIKTYYENINKIIKKYNDDIKNSKQSLKTFQTQKEEKIKDANKIIDENKEKLDTIVNDEATKSLLQKTIKTKEEEIKTHEKSTPDPPIKDEQTIKDEFEKEMQQYKTTFEGYETAYINSSSNLSKGIQKIVYLHKMCLQENIELVKLNVNENEIINLDSAIKHGTKDTINCLNIPDFNQSLDIMEKEYKEDMESLKF
jgi:hypothetical protein